MLGHLCRSAFDGTPATILPVQHLYKFRSFWCRFFKSEIVFSYLVFITSAGVTKPAAGTPAITPANSRVNG